MKLYWDAAQLSVTGYFYVFAIFRLCTRNTGPGYDALCLDSPILDPMRLVSLIAQATLTVRLVIIKVAFKPRYLAITLVGENMCGDAVEEPAIVRDDDGAAGEAEQGFFQCAQRFDVKIIGRFIEQQQVAAALEQLGQVYTIAFTARQVAYTFLLVASLEVEAADVGARLGAVIADDDLVEAIGYLFPDRFVAVQCIT